MQNKARQSNTGGTNHPLFLVSGVVAVVMGLIANSFGSGWSEQLYGLFADNEIMQIIGTYVPYVPFVPFYPMLLIMLGAFLVVKSRG